MRSRLAMMVLAAFGWRTEGGLPDAPKFVMLCVPHTSMWDAPILVLAGWAQDIPLVWLVKREMFRGPLAWLLPRLGGIPVQREAAHDATREALRALAEHERIALAIPPEGTRKRVEHWKMGFYLLARRARVPIVLGYMDYRRRVAGIGPAIRPTGDVEGDMARIRDFYEGVTGKYPDLFGPVQAEPR